MAEGVPFYDEKPGYDLGREVIVEASRPTSEINQNNGQFNSNMNRQAEEEKQQQSGWFSNPIMSSMWGYTSMALEKSAQALQTVGSTVQTKLDEHGITEKASSIVSAAAEKTSYIGSKIVEKGSETYETA